MKMNALSQQENLKKFTETSSCPVRNIISHFSGKWAMLVLCVLAENGVTRFNDIGRALPDISSKVLAETLKGLERDGLLSRRQYAEIPPRVEYSLTDLGLSLLPHLDALIGWSMEHFEVIIDNRNRHSEKAGKPG